MKKVILILSLLISIYGNSQSVTGKWKTIDDETGQPKSVVEIYEKSGKIYGKIVEIIDATKTKEICSKCTETEDKNMPILGMIIIKGLKKDGKEFSGGKILDPKSGKIYKCSLSLLSPDKLTVRGYIGVSLFGRSQTWIKVKS